MAANYGERYRGPRRNLGAFLLYFSLPRLCARRTRRKNTQAAVAALLGVHLWTVGRWFGSNTQVRNTCEPRPEAKVNIPPSSDSELARKYYIASSAYGAAFLNIADLIPPLARLQVVGSV